MFEYREVFCHDKKEKLSCLYVLCMENCLRVLLCEICGENNCNKIKMIFKKISTLNFYIYKN